MAHPSQQLVQDAVARAVSPLAEEVRQRHRVEAGIFRAEAEFDMDGLRQAIADLKGPHAIQPPEAPGWRGALGKRLIRWSSQVFWWVTRALKLRDHALMAMESTMLRQTRIRAAREIELYRRIHDLELRLVEMERRLKDSGS